MLAPDPGPIQTAKEHSPETILRFWRAVELLSPQPLRGPRESRRDEPIVLWQPGDPLPWQEGHDLRRRPPRDGAEWRHVVYLGVYDLALAVAELERHFGRDPDATGETAPGQACLAAGHRLEIHLQMDRLLAAAPLHGGARRTRGDAHAALAPAELLAASPAWRRTVPAAAAATGQLFSLRTSSPETAAIPSGTRTAPARR